MENEEKSRKKWKNRNHDSNSEKHIQINSYQNEMMHAPKCNKNKYNKKRFVECNVPPMYKINSVMKNVMAKSMNVDMTHATFSDPLYRPIIRINCK